MPILKSLILLLFLSVSVFAESYTIVSNPYQREFEKTNLEPVSSDLFRLLKGDSYVYYKIRDSFPDVYYFNTDTGMTGGVYKHSTGHYFLESSPSFKSVCGRPRTYDTFSFRDCGSTNPPDGNWWFSVSARKASKYIFNEVGTCKTDEDFNTVTGKCQKCPSGQTWNPKTNSCFSDCTDEKTNKYGWEDGSCTDCSAAKTTGEIYRCFCGSLGLGVPETFPDVGVIGKPGYFLGKCSNGYSFEYKDPDYKPDTPKPDDNKTKPDTPKPDDNKTKPDDPKPSDPTTPGTGDKGKDGKKDGKGNKDDAKGDNNTTIINNNNGNNNGKNNGNDPKFNPRDFNYDNLKKDEEGLTGKYTGAIGDTLKNFDGFKNGVDQFIDNVKGKGLSDISKQSVPKTCSHKENIDFFGHTITMDFDFCKIISPASGAFYYLFYVFFFGCFLFLIIKLLIFSF